MQEHGGGGPLVDARAGERRRADETS